MDFKGIEKKWLKRWEDAKIFEATPDKRDKFYITVAYPYPSGSMHVGHGRTYTVPDITARFKRMQGFNVLFPMAWHVTGTPVLGVAERIERGDEEALWLYGELYKVPKATLKRFTKPEAIVDYFSAEYRDIMSRMGYSIDWQRRFMTKDGQYNRFIEWQYLKLNGRGLITKGKHPVKYCPNDRNPVGDHDLLAGEKAEIHDFTLLKFRYNDWVLPAATLRPETIFGTTNLWLNPDMVYIKARVNGEIWVVSREASEKLSHQAKRVEIVGKIRGSELIDKDVIAPLTNKKVPILPATFLDPNYGTGVVFSVPAHAPFDYMALTDLQKAGYKTAIPLEPISIIDIEGYKSCPAKEICGEMGIVDQNDEKLEEATEVIYKEEHAKGRLKPEIEGFGGVSVNIARERVRGLMLEQGSGDYMYDFSERPVTCRCNTECVIKILEDQWFLRYSDEEWKKEAHKCFDGMEIVPPEVRANFDHVIDWLNDWACTRRKGLGTHLPWDRKWMIEPLSDSTIYMSYYTLSRCIKKIEPEKLDPEVFDYIFLGKGNIEKISKKYGIDSKLLGEMRSEFDYWYPSEWRFSAKDLIGNHLTFHVFHHTAVFPPKYWPKGIVVFGMGLLEGNKMSSSKGNVVLLEEAIDRHGADGVRLFLMGSAEPWQDFDWRENLVRTTGRQIDRFVAIAEEIIKMDEAKVELEAIDRWILSRLQKTIKETTDALENFQTRKALQNAFYLFSKDILWYMERSKGKAKGGILKGALDVWLRLLSPFIPYTCEELWERFGKTGFVSQARWPKVDERLIDEDAEAAEDFVKQTIEDVENILNVTGIKPKKIVMYTSSKWKWEVFKIASEVGKPEMKEIMSRVMQDEGLRRKGKEVVGYVNDIVKEMTMRRLEVEIDEYDVLSKSKAFFQKRFNSEVEIYASEGEAYDPMNKRRQARPLKPAIYVE
ncbi:MAG: leucine--tRNA ligase [Candidatus Hydrothermarchaeales archaeon]